MHCVHLTQLKQRLKNKIGYKKIMLVDGYCWNNGWNLVTNVLTKLNKLVL